jgi:hypothetical protein
MMATPPPLPVHLGLLRIEKFGGVRAVRVEGKVSGESQVSERVRISIASSDINSWRTAGLSRKGVMEEMEQVFKWTK